MRILSVGLSVLLASSFTTAQTQLIQTINSVGAAGSIPVPGSTATSPFNLGAIYCEFQQGLDFGLQGIPAIFLTPAYSVQVLMYLNLGPATAGVTLPVIANPLYVPSGPLMPFLFTIPAQNVGPAFVPPCAFPAPFPFDPGPSPTSFTAGFQYSSPTGGFSVPTGLYPLTAGPMPIGQTFTFQALTLLDGPNLTPTLYASNAIQVN